MITLIVFGPMSEEGFTLVELLISTTIFLLFSGFAYSFVLSAHNKHSDMQISDKNIANLVQTTLALDRKISNKLSDDNNISIGNAEMSYAIGSFDFFEYSKAKNTVQVDLQKRQEAYKFDDVELSFVVANNGEHGEKRSNGSLLLNLTTGDVDYQVVIWDSSFF